MKKIIILTGPTASGKTALGISLALERGGYEIINADSMLVYRKMDVGTAKPTPSELAEIPHHLINIREPNEAFTAGDFVRETRRAIDEITQRGKRPIIVGGTGFYLKALLYGLWDAPKADPSIRKRLDQLTSPDLYDQLTQRDSVSALRIGINDRYRLVRALELIEASGKSPTELQAAQSTEPDPLFDLWVLDRPNAELHERIERRTRQMLDSGLIEEVQKIRTEYPGARALASVGYRQVCDQLDGVKPAGRIVKPGLPGLEEEISLATRQLVKSQRTWFRANKNARWFMLDQDLPLLKQAFSQMES